MLRWIWTGRTPKTKVEYSLAIKQIIDPAAAPLPNPVIQCAWARLGRDVGGAAAPDL